MEKNKQVFKSQSAEETRSIALGLANQFQGGNIIFLSGDLGSGKTSFCQGVAQYYSIKEKVNSPTFVLIKTYPCQNQSSKIKFLAHVDAYRINKTTNLENTGILDYLGRQDTLCLVEWPEKIDLKIKASHRVKFEICGQSERIIHFSELD